MASVPVRVADVDMAAEKTQDADMVSFTEVIRGEPGKKMMCVVIGGAAGDEKEILIEYVSQYLNWIADRTEVCVTTQAPD